MDTKTEIENAADRVINAFGSFDRNTYFGYFDPSATVVFYYSPNFLTLPEYQQLWDSWAHDGFEVLSCSSTNRLVQVIDENVGLLIHDVHTVVRRTGERQELNERETILLRKDPYERWLVVHEHLSHPES